MNKIEKIRKILELADRSKNPYEEEASLAMKKAMEMMNLEGLTISDIKESSIEEELGELGESWLNGEESKQLHNWKKVLISNLAYFFDCSIINYTEGRKTKILIVGRANNRITCEMFYNWIHDRTMKEAREKYGSQTAKRNSYCIGVANGLAYKVHELKPRGDKVNGWGIIPMNEVENYLTEKHPNVISKKLVTTASDREALRSGESVGKSTSLNRQFGLKCIA